MIRRALFLPLVLLHAAALAADAPITPGSVQSTIEPGQPRIPATKPQVLLPQQQPPSQHDPRGRRFRVNAFDMVGNTAFSSFLLKRLVERFVDMELNLYDLHRAADTITEFYHDRGYTLAYAAIPAQTVLDGRVQIRIIEGRIGTVVFSGNRRHSNAFLAARTGAMQPGALVTSDRLESTLLLMNDNPGLSTKAILTPGAEFGTTDAEIQVSEKAYSGSVSVNNHGRRETGSNRLETTLNANSPFGWGDQLALSASSTQQSLVRYWKVGYSLPVNTLGTRLAASNSRSEYAVSGALAALGISGDVRTNELTLTHPFLRTRHDSRWISLAFKRSALSQTALGQPVSNTTINVLTATGLMNLIHDDASVTNASLSLTTNFKSLHGVPRQDAVFARLETDVSHTAPFVQKWDIHLRGNAVFSRDMLPDTEKFSLGGPSSIRAFRPSEVRGDSGFQATAEFRHPFTFLERTGSFRLTGDIGEVVYKAPAHNDSRDHLRSVGIGASFYPFSGSTLSVDAARQVGNSRTSNEGRRHRLWVNFSANF